MHFFERLDDVGFVLFVVPEEILALGEFLFFAVGGVDGLQGVRVQTGVERLGGHCHGGGGEVLHLLQMIT